MSAAGTAVAGRLPRVQHESGARFRISIGEHTVHVDQPTADGGDNSAPTPVELFVGSLAACVAYYAHRFLARRGRSAAGLSVSSDYGYASHPHRVGTISLRIDVPGGLGPEEREALVAVASRCTVQRTLDHRPEVEIAVAG